MTWIDYTIIGIIIISTIVGFARGFVREIFSILFWILAFWIAWEYFHFFADYLRPWVDSQPIRFGIAFIGLFAITMILGSLIVLIIGRIVDYSPLSFIDQFLGTIFGLLRGALIVLIFALVGGLTTIPKESWWQESQFLTPLEKISKQIINQFPPNIARYFRS